MAALLPALGQAAIGVGGSLLASELAGGGGSVGRQTEGQRRRAVEAGQRLSRPAFRRITTPGAKIRLGGGTARVSRRPGVTRTLRAGERAGTQAGRDIGGILSRLSPRFAETIEASQGLVGAGRDVFGRSLERLLEDRGASVNTLRQNLSRRGILGSSFGEQAISERIGEFADRERDLTAEESFFNAQQAQQLQENLTQNLLQETALRTQLIQERSNIIQASIDREIEQTNFETQIARDLAISTQQALTAGNAAIIDASVDQGTLALEQQRIDADRAAGVGAFIEPVLSEAGSTFGNILGGLFNRQAPTPAGVGRVA